MPYKTTSFDDISVVHPLFYPLPGNTVYAFMVDDAQLIQNKYNLDSSPDIKTKLTAKQEPYPRLFRYILMSIDINKLTPNSVTQGRKLTLELEIDSVTDGVGDGLSDGSSYSEASKFENEYDTPNTQSVAYKMAPGIYMLELFLRRVNWAQPAEDVPKTEQNLFN
ncbi:hypothetical protein H0H92_000263 [Tricholoma furcatifolium]|nr:hypothetical protein H0H92_000263 [Tricholoma furcatifolium]